MNRQDRFIAHVRKTGEKQLLVDHLSEVGDLCGNVRYERGVMLQSQQYGITGAKALLAVGKTPPPIPDKSRCKACSLVELCGPDAFHKDHSALYINELFGSITDKEESL